MKTKEELNAIKNELETLNAKLAELSEDEMKQVTGGSIYDWFDRKVDEFDQWISSDMDYKSGDIPMFNPGQAVYFYYLDRWRSGEIVSADSKDGGVFNTEFVYTIRHIGSTITSSGIYESNIRAR